MGGDVLAKIVTDEIIISKIHYTVTLFFFNPKAFFVFVERKYLVLTKIQSNK